MIPLLKNWSARRAGAHITIVHAEGKVVGIDRIEPVDGRIIATDKDGAQYVLDV